MNYKISEEDYITVLEQQMKQKRKNPIQLAITFISTIGQTLAVLYMILASRIAGMNALFLAVLSIALTVLSVVNFRNVHPRAKNYLELLRSKGKISEEFWKLHTLKVDDEKLSVHFGSYANSCEITQIRLVDNHVNAYLLYLGQTQSIFDIVPYSAFGDEKQRTGFSQTILRAAFQSALRDSEEIRDSISPEARVLAEFTYDEASYLKDQRDAFRRMFSTKLAWTPLSIVLLVIPCISLFYAFSDGRIVLILLAVAATLLLNFHYVRIFSPLIDRKIKRGYQELLPYFPDGRYKALLDKAQKQIVLAGSIFCMAFPFSEIKAVRKIPGGAALYLNQNLVFTLPFRGDISELQSTLN